MNAGVSPERNSPKTVKSPIARAEFVAVKKDETSLTIKMCIFPPEPDPESERHDYRCWIQMEGFSESVYSYGTDSLQALSLSCSYVHRELLRLERAGWDMTIDGKKQAGPSLLSSYFPGLPSRCE